jgi:hypothetical protein
MVMSQIDAQRAALETKVKGKQDQLARLGDFQRVGATSAWKPFEQLLGVELDYARSALETLTGDDMLREQGRCKCLRQILLYVDRRHNERMIQSLQDDIARLRAAMKELPGG